MKPLIQSSLAAEAARQAGRTLLVPQWYTLVCGAADGSTDLTAFDRALTAAGAGNFNLVKVTSILPPRALPGVIADLHPGEVVHAAMGTATSRQKGELISAAVAVGVPKNPEVVGVLMEGSFRAPASEAEEQVRRMAHQALIDRGSEMARIESRAIEWRVKEVGSVVAAVLLW